MKTIDQMIAVMESFRDGAQIEWSRKGSTEWSSCEFPPTWSWVDSDYRVKPVTKTLEIYIDRSFDLGAALQNRAYDIARQTEKHRSKKVTITWEE